MMTMMTATDAVTSIPLHRSTLRVLQRVKSAAETWDEFLINVTDDYLSPALKVELDRRLRTDLIVTGAEAHREFREQRKRAR
jgi:ATP:corrinoid adenosyltransferase